MDVCDASTPGLLTRAAYLVFVPEAEALVCKQVFSVQKDAFDYSISVGGFVVNASRISQIRNPVEEVTVHELRLEE